ncbi:MAG: hypothetical protein EBE86_009125 [Hormoscilla sp. GUM202]|nr:hypothetical protein [Hormoscilla sp. GUM202]
MSTVGLLRSIGFVFLTSTAVLTLVQPGAAQIERPERPAYPQPLQELEENSSDLRPLKDSGLLSMAGGEKLIDEANTAVSAGNYDLAVEKLRSARQVFNQLSNFYQQLAGSFTGIDNRIADGQRRQALESAQKRDETTYQLALVYRAQNQPELAVPLLIQIIRSQNPTRDLGKKAYQQLFELGFVDSPYPRPSDNQSSSDN